nr:5131_t:CDS:10 [Entrophospora candida]
MGLAGPKVKQRLSADPRNLSWSNDETKFGYKMLSKMGWSPGKGLGAKEDGKNEHIKLSIKQDNLGVGATKKTMDNWLENTNAFDQLLKGLNQQVEENLVVNLFKGEDGDNVNLDDKKNSKLLKIGKKKKVKRNCNVHKSIDDSSNKNISFVRLAHRAKFRKSKQALNQDGKKDSNLIGIQTTVNQMNTQEYFANKLKFMNISGIASNGSEANNHDSERPSKSSIVINHRKRKSKKEKIIKQKEIKYLRSDQYYKINYNLNPIYELRAKAEQLLDNAFPTFSETISSRTNGTTSNVSPLNVSPLGVKILSPVDTSMCCRWLLEKSNSPYALMFASARLKSLVLDHYSMFTAQQKLELRNFILNYMFQKPNQPPFILSSLAQLFATISKVGWFDGDEFKNIKSDLTNFIQATYEHRIIGLQILGIVVVEFNQPSSRNLARQRKTAIGFRDAELLDIFRLGLDVLRQILSGEMQSTDENQECRMKDYCLTLLRNCLAFDFIGTSPDESGEDVGSIQVMEVLVQISSIRRSLFNEEERSKFITALMKGIREILVSSIGLDDLNNYHEFCRLLSRFRSTYQWSEIAEKTEYSEWIDLVARFSIKGFENWQLVPNSVQYLLAFWSKMLSSMGSARSLSVNRLELIASELTYAYVTSKIESVESVIEGVVDDPLENEEALMNDLEMFAVIARCKYTDSKTAITISGISANNLMQELDVIETKFAWLVYMIGGLIGGRQTYSSTEDQDIIDGELTCKVLQLMSANQSWNAPRGSGNGCEKLELSFVYFFQQFRKSYIGESSQRISKVYSKLSENLGINDQNMLLEIIVRKIATNLQTWGDSSSIVKQSVTLLNDLAGGYSSVRLLRKIETTQLIVRNHTAKNFSFLNVSDNLRIRMVYYSALSRILFAAEDNIERDFEEFVKPWDDTLKELRSLNSLSTLAWIFRDLRGFLSAIQNRKNFLVFFEWFYPDHMQVLYNALEACSNDTLSVTFLKFFLEFVNNRSTRLNFDISSPNGILIFRETSKVISLYGRHVNNHTFITQDKYTELYKSISVCFNILTKSFAGRYVNFGVFELYGDKALEIALNTSFDMILRVSIDDLLQSSRSKPKPHWLLTYLSRFPDILRYLFVVNFNVVLFEERQNQWSLSRPLLCLILLNKDVRYLNEYTQTLLQYQLPERRSVLHKALSTLMDDVESNLASKNRDRFTQNLTTFKRELTNENAILVQPPLDPSLSM